jgi:hypothetical protein
MINSPEIAQANATGGAVTAEDQRELTNRQLIREQADLPVIREQADLPVMLAEAPAAAASAGSVLIRQVIGARSIICQKRLN